MTAGWLAMALFPALAQEASFDVPITISGAGYAAWGGAGRTAAGARAVAYPYVRLGNGFFLGGTLQAYTRPYFREQFATAGHGARGDVLQAYAGYARYWGRNAIVWKAGILSSAFGSFLLRYDDAVNPLLDSPLGYGYYYKAVSTLGLAGTQLDVTIGKLDGRVQFVNSSAANRRSLFDEDQYGQWAGGAGITVVQGFRIGSSFYRGPYLHRRHRYYMPGESPPAELPATGYGADIQFARGHLCVAGEVNRFQRAYRVMPTVNQTVAWGEAKYAVSPRLFLAVRAGMERWNLSYIPAPNVYELGFGWRLNRRQLVKAGYQRSSVLGGMVGVQLVTQVSPAL